MSRITNEVLAERIDGMKEHFNDKIDGLDKNFCKFQKSFNENIVPDIRQNTKFRQQAKGIIGAVSFICMAFGGLIVWLADKVRFWEK